MNLAARLQSAAEPGDILITEATWNLVRDEVDCEHNLSFTPKGFARPVEVYKAHEFKSGAHRESRRRLSRVGDHVEVNVIDSSDIRAAIAELRRIQKEFEDQLAAE